jgi:hypothetical protein
MSIVFQLRLRHTTLLYISVCLYFGYVERLVVLLSCLFVLWVCGEAGGALVLFVCTLGMWGNVMDIINEPRNVLINDPLPSALDHYVPSIVLWRFVMFIPRHKVQKITKIIWTSCHLDINVRK